MVRKVYQAFQAVQVFPEHRDPRVLVVLMDCPVTRVRRGLLAGLATAVQLELLERLVIRDWPDVVDRWDLVERPVSRVILVTPDFEVSLDKQDDKDHLDQPGQVGRMETGERQVFVC